MEKVFIHEKRVLVVVDTAPSEYFAKHYPGSWGGSSRVQAAKDLGEQEIRGHRGRLYIVSTIDNTPLTTLHHEHYEFIPQEALPSEPPPHGDAPPAPEPPISTAAL